MREASVADHHRDCARDGLGVEVTLHGVMNAREALRREPEILRPAGDDSAPAQGGLREDRRLQRQGEHEAGRDNRNQHRIRR